MFVRVLFGFLIGFCSFRNSKSFQFNFHKPALDSQFNFKRDYEIVYFPSLGETFGENEQVLEDTFDFTVFGRSVSLKLKPNDNLISPNFKAYLQNEDDDVVLMQRLPRNCHYLHRDSLSVAAISVCQPQSIQGLLFLENSTFEIHPLTHHLPSYLEETVNTDKYPHLIRRVVLDSSASYHTSCSGKRRHQTDLERDLVRNFATHNAVVSTTPLTAELALFLDAEAYKIFAPYFNDDDDKLIEMLLVYINSVQALYHHPSIGNTLDLVLVRLDIMKTQPAKMPHYDGEQSKLLDSFCSYQSSLNSESDDDPNHWDMALYISGLDFFANENGHKSEVTMGLAAVGGICYSQYACVIAELGTVSVFGNPYPSAGFTSVYVLAHEIGHNLGMHHDGSKNNCPKEGFIMSPSRGDFGEAQWSSCSAEVMSKLKNAKCLQDFTGVPNSKFDHSRFKDVPGQVYLAKKQCEVLLKDKDAVVSPNQKLSDICYSLECKTPHRSGTYFSGPALEGTECGKNMHCSGGECVSGSVLRSVGNAWTQEVKQPDDYIEMPDDKINVISKQTNDFFEFLN